MSIDEHIENLFDEPDKVLDGEKKISRLIFIIFIAHT